jgi:hypothetical protein
MKDGHYPQRLSFHGGSDLAGNNESFMKGMSRDDQTKKDSPAPANSHAVIK